MAAISAFTRRSPSVPDGPPAPPARAGRAPGRSLAGPRPLGGPAAVPGGRGASLRELPGAVVELDDHARALVDAVQVAILEVVDAVRADDFLRAHDRVAQRLAKRRRPRLDAFLDRALGGVGEDHPGV